MPYARSRTPGLPMPSTPEPGRHYRWLADDPDRLAGHVAGAGEAPGYRIECTGMARDAAVKHVKSLGFSEHMLDTTNRIRFGRLILGSIPLDEANRRIAESRDDARDRLSANIESVESIRGRGFRARVEEVGELASRREFATRPSNNRVSLASGRRGDIDAGE